MSDTDARDAEVVPGNGQSDSRQPARPEDNLPTEILALPLNQRPVFPSMMLPLSVSAGPLADAVRHAIDHRGGWVGFFLTYKPLEEGAAFNPADLHPAGCVVRILKHQVNDSGALQISAKSTRDSA